MAIQLQRDLMSNASDTDVIDRSAPATTIRPGTADVGSAHAVEAFGLTKSFGARRVLDGVDLSLRAGEFVAIIGRSGTGKSTLLRILGGLDPMFSGTADVPANRAVVFQEPRLLPWKRVVDNVRLGLPGAEGKQLAAAALEEVGLAGHVRAWPKTLSGGEAQRVALARALVRDPELSLLDEPFGALDALTRIKMHVLLQELCRRHDPAVLLVTHDVDEAILLADRVVVLDEGRIALDVVISLPAPRLRADTEFGELRSLLLAALGIDEDAEGNHT
jgi:sulfonate transport system ATP-binding protein